MKTAILAFSIPFATAISSAAIASDPPRLKLGLWAMHIQSSFGGAAAAVPSTICVGAMSDQQRQLEQSNIKNRCSKFEVRQAAGTSIVDAVCTNRYHTITKHTVTSLSGDSFHELDTGSEGTMASDGT